MFKPKEYIGISLEGDSLKFARVVSEKNKLRVVRVDQLTLVNPIKQANSPLPMEDEESDAFEDELDADLIFGLDNGTDKSQPEETAKKSSAKEETDELFGEIDLAELDEEEFGEDPREDLMAETDESISNEKLVYDYLSSVDSERKYVAVNIPAGDTIFQFLNDLNYSELKKKELVDIIEDKLYSLYNRQPNVDLYDFEIRDDGTLVIGSLEYESPTLSLVFNAGTNNKEKYLIGDVTPDESVMAGLYREHYEMNPEIVSALLQVGKTKSRLLFLKGEQLLQVSPVINEGYDDKNYLSTIFSKILFQIDTGEVPGLDQLIIFNNGKGTPVLDFFRESFSELKVEEFTFDDEKVIYGDTLSATVPFYTTAIGLAEIAAKSEITKKIRLSFLPSYVIDQQKIFRLQWHGILLLILIGLSPVVLNHFYQQNQSQIESLESESSQLTQMITNVEPLVTRSEQLSQELSTMQEQLTLLQELNENNIKWTVTLNEFNRAVQNTGSLWVSSFRQNEDLIMVDGFSLYQERIPELASQFETVTLLNVRKQEIREREIYAFSMMIRDVVDDPSLFTPQWNPEISDASTP
ncbi:PilN domain-containing protein [Rhodohalobacter sp. 8-1]|uniref:PilN domain-containing protein n=1 Tax=Rhodohalobacter sp. 8-1 TaxID=3131972 RepID=UPI0030ED8B0F